MTPDDSQLIAYADGRLGATQTAWIERELAASAELRDSVVRLRASRLPYRQAFAAQILPAVPAALRRFVEGIGQEGTPSDGR
ncbi:hypothetical protein [Burkholderia sp. Ac-20379]|uniref:hypothetical protein n=1 Tax=Burkholderia sp. Ac-20379 TaxID=2703900 RepID=UPI0019818112|nr:hypothetical protein [Burkholderia sp. Ac-20379]MBN3726547.1 hypothetical protein [Burkholderia sp. Ac-20379]